MSQHVRNNSVAVSDIPTLIGNVHTALAGLEQQVAAPAPLRPAIANSYFG
jgi:predicted transcriptional regulator